MSSLSGSNPGANKIPRLEKLSDGERFLHLFHSFLYILHPICLPIFEAEYEGTSAGEDVKAEVPMSESSAGVDIKPKFDPKPKPDVQPERRLYHLLVHAVMGGEAECCVSPENKYLGSALLAEIMGKIRDMDTANSDELLGQLYSLEMATGSIDEFFSVFESIYSRVNLLAGNGERMTERQRVSLVISKIPDSYDDLRENLEDMDNATYACVKKKIKRRMHRVVHRTSSGAQSAHYAQDNSGDRPVCANCKRVGHLKQACWQPGGGDACVCTKCGGHHPSRLCRNPGKKQKSKFANLATALSATQVPGTHRQFISSQGPKYDSGTATYPGLGWESTLRERLAQAEASKDRAEIELSRIRRRERKRRTRLRNVKADTSDSDDSGSEFYSDDSDNNRKARRRRSAGGLNFISLILACSAVFRTGCRTILDGMSNPLIQFLLVILPLVFLCPGWFGASSTAVALASSTISSEAGWLVDSGASCHMTECADLFSAISDIPPVSVYGVGPAGANGSSMLVATQSGMLSVPVMCDDGSVHDLKLENVLLVPGIGRNLVSVDALVAKGAELNFSSNGAQLTVPGSARISLARKSGLFELPLLTNHTAAAVRVKPDYQLMHRRLGHPGESIVSRMSGLANTTGAPCESCQMNKAIHRSFSKRRPEDKRATKPYQRIHTDLWGPSNATSLGGAKYICAFVDDFTREATVYFLKRKKDAAGCFEEFLHDVVYRQNHSVSVLRADNGGEFVGRAFKRVLREHRVTPEFSPPHSPQSNGTVERFWGTVIPRAKAMLYDSGLSLDFWAESVRSSVYLYNRLPSSALDGVSPIEFRTGERPDIEHLRCFGATAYVLNERASKIGPNATRQVLLGYADDCSAYRVYNPLTRKVTNTVHVTFNEARFGWSTSEFGAGSHTSASPPTFNLIAGAGATSSSVGDVDGPSVRIQIHADGCESPVTASDCGPSPSISPPPLEPGTPMTSPASSAASSPSNAESPRASRFADDYRGSATTGGNGRPSRTVRRPDRPGFVFLALLAALGCDPSAPDTYFDALCDPRAPEWKEAMDREYDSLIQFGTWDEQLLPPGAKLVDTRWVYRCKFDAGGNLVCYKARFCAKGFSQRQGVDYFETFAPVIRLESVRTLVALAAENDWELFQADVSSAFLNAELEETVFIRQPRGYETYAPNGQQHVLRLHRSIYGLRQAPRCWNTLLHKFLLAQGLQRSEADPCVYIKRTKAGIVVVGIYVDDLLFTGSDRSGINDLRAALADEFKIKDLGILHHYLGIAVNRTAGGITMSQRQYVVDLLNQFGMEECHPTATPLVAKQKLTRDMSPVTDAELQRMADIPYRSAVGSLMYLALATRPDIANAVRDLARYSHNPGWDHWLGVKHVFRYLQGTKDLGITYTRTNESLLAYSDSDWANDESTSRSVTGNVFILANAAITWASRSQKHVSLSSSEAEYVAASNTAKQCMFVRHLVSELCPDLALLDQPTVMLIDNRACRLMIKNRGSHRRTKHIRVRYHFIRELAEDGVIDIQPISSKENLADMFTKNLTRVPLSKLRARVFGIASE